MPGPQSLGTPTLVTIDERMADAVRRVTLGLGVNPGGAFGMADVASVLWARSHKFDAADPTWPDRDRFVLSAHHASLGALHHAILQLTGHAGLDAAAPTYGSHPAIEAASGPRGHGLATAVGMALAERIMAARFGKSLVDHRTWVLADSADLITGISHEAASLAGDLRLEKLTVMVEDASVTAGAAGSAPAGSLPSGGDEMTRRFAAYGWAIRQVDGHDSAAIAAALGFATRSQKPTLIACQVDTAPRGVEAPRGELAADILAAWHRAGSRGATARRSWLKRLARHPLRPEFERALAGRLPDGWQTAMAGLKARVAADRAASVPASPAGAPTAEPPAVPIGAASRLASFRTLQALVPAVADLVGGTAAIAGAELTKTAAMTTIGPGAYGGRHIEWGSREPAMAAAMNGLALHGGLIPYAASELCASDVIRPAIRLAATMRRQLVHLLIQDDDGDAGPAGPAPLDQLAGLRAIANAYMFRPADPIETVECWELALRRNDGPSLLVLGNLAMPSLRAETAENHCARGGYLLAEADGPRRATLIASGPEVAVALAARAALAADGIHVAVVSLVCWELFALQDELWRQGVLGTVPRFGIEAACGFGWERWLGPEGYFIGCDHFSSRSAGAALPGPSPLKGPSTTCFGLSSESIYNAVRKRLTVIPAGDL